MSYRPESEGKREAGFEKANRSRTNLDPFRIKFASGGNRTRDLAITNHQRPLIKYIMTFDFS
jgi:hypothetical protein